MPCANICVSIDDEVFFSPVSREIKQFFHHQNLHAASNIFFFYSGATGVVIWSFQAWNYNSFGPIFVPIYDPGGNEEDFFSESSLRDIP